MNKETGELIEMRKLRELSPSDRFYWTELTDKEFKELLTLQPLARVTRLEEMRSEHDATRQRHLELLR